MARQTVRVRASVTLDRSLPWVLRGLWVALVVVGGGALDEALADASASTRDVVPWIAFSGWAIAMVAVAVPSVVSLTAARVVVPLAVPASAATWVAGASAVSGAGALGLAALAAALVASAELGRAFVQASAYGDEDRFPLRPPAAYLLAAGLAWAVAGACLLAGAVLVADRSWIAGGVLSVAGIATSAWAWPRWHRLSRRWLVLVPAGLVVHDHVALAETLMIRRPELAGLRLAPVDTEALDLTGPAGGHAVEIATTDALTAIVGAGGPVAAGTAVHVTACLVAPSRPGRVLGAAARRRLPVG